MALVVLALFYNIAILAGCAYLVFWRRASPWWFVLAVLLLAQVKTGTAG